ncbi:hypothetical protein JKY72_03400 [Candidatus Gracilibacteria bacterium]|nr:hypothetical protein [Candidatus Gracilibacteria bacterium]
MTPPNKPKRSAESSTRRPSARGEGLTARRKVSERLSEKLNKPLELFGMDVEKEREHISDALDDIDDQLDDLLTVDRKIPRIKAGISSIKITLKAPIRRYKVRWTALRVKYLSPPNGKSVTQGDSEKYTAELKTLIEEIEQYVKNVTAYIKELREGEGGYLTEAVIMRLETEGPKFVAALQGDKEMQEAMTAILKGFSGDKEAKKSLPKSNKSNR